ncbi:MAG: transcription termination factor NusA [Gammaproteobacteria bacterium]|nr:transcription termination factor NusA [Gammaproteobacteria bacterium]
MVNKEFFAAINELCEERGLSKESVFAAIERGVVTAYRKEKGVNNIRVHFNEENNEYNFYEYYEVVTEDELDESDPSKVTLKEAKVHKKSAKLGDKFEIKRNVNPKDFGRIAINATKQVLNQDIKKLEREKSFAFFEEHQDEVIDGTVVRVNNNFVTLDLGHDVLVSLPINEIGRPDAVLGQKIKLYLSKVEMTQKGPKVSVSRSDKNLIKRLFEDFISEVKDGTVEIVGIAREVGDRTKVCVKSNNPDVDPLGSCLGPKGTRIQDIIKRLNGEKIDLYEYSDDPKTLITNALKPAEVIGVTFNEETKEALAIVPNDHFSLAIGKRGQNVKLAVQSCGWKKIDIKSVDQALAEGIEF